MVDENGDVKTGEPTEETEDQARVRVMGWFEAEVWAFVANIRAELAALNRNLLAEQGVGDVEGIERSLSSLENLEYQSGEEGRYMHDVANYFSIVGANIDFVLGDFSNVSVKELFASLRESYDCINRVRAAVDSARKRVGSWADVNLEPAIVEEKTSLVLPDGVKHICVVDDNVGVRDVLGAAIERAGGTAYPCSGIDDLAMIVGREEDRNVQVVLLDHDLGEEYGYKLIPSLKLAFPTALIISCTAEAEEILADKENPYSAAGIKYFVKKPIDWGHVSKILKEHFNK
ncbi:MAG: response regulator [Candidatus Peregrinibacteria bacterium]